MTAAEQRPTCATCVYWERLDDEIGKCRKLSPRYTSAALGRWCDDTRDDKGMRHDHNCTAWPVTFECDWCGHHPDFPAWIEHSRREKAIHDKHVAWAKEFQPGQRVRHCNGTKGRVLEQRGDDNEEVCIQFDNGVSLYVKPRDIVKIDTDNS